MSDFFSAKPENIEYEFLTPGDNEPSGVFVELRPKYAKEAQAVERRIAMQTRKKRKGNLTPNEIRDNLREMWAARVARWYSKDPAMDVEGRLGECTHANVVKFFANYPWYEDQVIEELGDADAFFETAEKPEPISPDTSPDTQ